MSTHHAFQNAIATGEAPFCRRNRLIQILLAAGAFMGATQSQAADRLWAPPLEGGGGSISWNNSTNWGGTIPANNILDDTAVFNGTTAYNFQPTLDAFTVQSANGVRIGGASAVALTLSAGSGTQITSGSTPSGSPTILMADVTGLAVGQHITGTGIPLGTFITGIAGNTITLSRNTTAIIADGQSRTFTSSLRLGSGGISLSVDTPNVANTITAPIVLGTSQIWSNNTVNRTLTIQGAIYLDNHTLTLSGEAGSTISFNGANNLQSIGGSGGIVVDTGGSVNFGPGTGGRQANSFTGGVILKNGRIILNGSNTGAGTMGALGTGVFTINGGEIAGAGNSAGKPLTVSSHVWNADWNLVSNRSVDMGSGDISLGTAAGTTRTLGVTDAAQTLTFGGGISDGATAKSLAFVGPGTLILTGSSSYTGSTSIGGGILQIGLGGDRLPTTTVLTVAGGALAANAGTFDLNGRNQSVAGLSGGAGLVKGLVINRHATDLSTLTVTGTSIFDGILEDGPTAKLALTKSTGGILTLGGANSYTGATTINGGTLVVASTGSIASGSAVTVNHGGTLAGTGTVAGMVTVNSGGTLSPGASPGLQNFGDLVLNDGGHYNWQILDAEGAAGTGYDTYTLSGTLDLGGLTGATKFNINLWSLSGIGPDVNGLASNFDNTADQSWTLISTPNTITGFDASYFAVNVGANNGTAGFANALGGGTFSVGLADGNTDLVLNFIAIPEPSTLLLVGGGLLAAVLSYRRRRK